MINEVSKDKMRLFGVLLKRFVEFVESSSEKDLQRLVEGKAKLEIRATTSSRNLVSSKINRGTIDNDFLSIRKELELFESREEANNYLKGNLPLKSQLEAFCRFLDLPVYRSDKVNTLRERIVESLVGSRLRSKAVQGKKFE